MSYLDDTHHSLQWSGEWRQQPSNDSIAANSWGNTYHVTQSNGNNLSFLFNTSVLSKISIYGSKGPGHANFSVLVADSDKFIYSASAEKFQARQLLWSVNISKSAVILLSSIVVGENNWLDLDYIKFEQLSNATSVSPYTSTNAAVLSSLQTSTSFRPTATSSNLPPSSTSPSGSQTFRVTTILTVVFGGLLALLTSGIFIFAYIRRRKRRLPAPKKVVRIVSPTPLDYTGDLKDPLTVFADSQSPASSPLPGTVSKSFSQTEEHHMSSFPQWGEQPTLGIVEDTRITSSIGWSGRTIAANTDTQNADIETGIGSSPVELGSSNSECWNKKPPESTASDPLIPLPTPQPISGSDEPVSHTAFPLHRKASNTASNTSSYPSLYAREPTRPPPLPPVPSPQLEINFYKYGLPPSTFSKWAALRGYHSNTDQVSEERVRVGYAPVRTPPNASVLHTPIPSSAGTSSGDGQSAQSTFLRL